MERLDMLMGTVVTQKVYGRHAAAASNQALTEMQRLERVLSVFVPESDIARVNAGAGISPARVSDETLEILQAARHVSEMSGGAFDITIRPLSRLWAVTSDQPQVPSREAVTAALALVGYKHMILDSEHARCYLPDQGRALDLGGIAKGYAADRVMDIYRSAGVKSAMVDLGGNACVLGSRPDGSPWAIGIQDPNARRGEVAGVLHLSDTSVVTSGAYERGFSAGGVWYHHIIDPRTGYPADTDVASATVVARQSMLADALSTAVFVLGSDPGLALVAKFEGTEALIIEKDRSFLLTGGLKRHFEGQA